MKVEGVPYRTIWVEKDGWSVGIIDQTKLPHGFETLTLAPIDLSLVEPKLMDAEEIAWLDAYHARVRKTLSPLVDAPTRRWLTQATRRLAPRKGKGRR